MSTLVELPEAVSFLRAIARHYEGPARDKLTAAADALSARLTPPAEVVRYEMRACMFHGSPAYNIDEDPEGEWVRYEDHAAALAAARAVPAPDPLQPKCQHCNDTGLVAINATTGIYVRPGPVPHDARGYAENPCWECNAYPGGFDGPTGAE